MSAPIRLDPAEYTAVWRCRGAKPAVLHTPDHGATLTARDALDAAAWARLAARGLARGTAPEPALDDLLGVLAAPDAEIHARVWAGGPASAVRGFLVVAREDVGVAAELDGAGGLRIDPVDGRRPAAALLARLPRAAALPGVPMTVPAAALDAPDGPERERRLWRAGVPRPTVRRLVELWSAPPLRVAQIGFARRERDGRWRRERDPIEVVDAEAGRVAIVRHVDGRHLTVRPADPAWLCTEITARLAEPPSPRTAAPVSDRRGDHPADH